MKQRIDAAIAAHGTWKSKLKTAIDGGDIPKSATVRLDNQCDFGKWLQTVTPLGENAEHIKNVKQAHADFHRAAAAVLGDIEAGRKVSLDTAIGAGSAFMNASSKLTLAMLAWKKAS